jgi:hypothetical protein
MKIGMLLPSAGQQATRENIIHAAMQAEEERFDSLWGMGETYLTSKATNTISIGGNQIKPNQTENHANAVEVHTKKASVGTT